MMGVCQHGSGKHQGIFVLAPLTTRLFFSQVAENLGQLSRKAKKLFYFIFQIYRFSEGRAIKKSNLLGKVYTLLQSCLTQASWDSLLGTGCQ